MSKYDFELDLDNENSLSIMLKMINANSTVLEFGSANGRMTRYLKEKLNCTVDIVEIDEEAGKEAAQFSREALLGNETGDIEKFLWREKLQEQRYDYITFADVLEHLINPEEVLKQARGLLKEHGYVLLSVPNIAHNAILLNLFHNDFPYKEIGLLDNTHIHFFAYKSLKNMIQACGYYPVEEKATFCNAENTEFHASYDAVSLGARKELCAREYGNVYQFVFKIADRSFRMDADMTSPKCEDQCMDYEFVCYYKTDDIADFSEEYCKKEYFKPGKNRFVLDFSNCAKVTGLRVDPLFCNCIIDNFCVIECSIDQRLHVLSANGLQDANKYIFNTDDPMLLIDVPENGIKKIEVSFDVLDYENHTIDSIYQKQEQVEKLKQEIEAKNRNIKELECEIEDKKDNIKELRCEIDIKEKIISDNNKNLEDIQQELEHYKTHYFAAIDQREDLKGQLRVVNQAYSDILNSECWKLTAPLRKVLGRIERSNMLFLMKKGIKSLQDNGVSTTWKKVKRFLGKEIGVRTSNNNTEAGIESICLAEVEELPMLKKSIAVHLHLFYVDLLEEFYSYLNHIPYEFDLYVSCKNKAGIEKIKEKFQEMRNVKKVIVQETINRGRDIAPFYVQFAEQLKNYDYLLHIHSKKSLFTGKEQYGWRQYSLDALLGNEALIRKIFALFESKKKIGLFFPETYVDMHIIAQDWLANKQIGKELLDQIGIEFDDGLFNYPVGSFFWVKKEAIRPIFDLKLKYEDFPEESGQTDGTLAHALERVLAFAIKKQGYTLAIHDYENSIVSIGKSYKLFQDYFSLTSDAVQYHLSKYELVSFDIFDTLITRCVLNPDDVFKIVENKIMRQYGIQIDFVKIRKNAEQLAWSQKRARTNIYDIYAALPHVCRKIDEKLADQIMQMEIDTEIEACIPRRDMLKVFDHVKQNHRKIVLVSDMYLTSDIISQMLDRCGYQGYDDIWVSCEKGVRKDDGTMWDMFFDAYGKFRTIHVGDNPRSDIQLVGDKARDTFYVINPVTAFKLSRYYTAFKKYVNTTIENSICMGLIINDGLYNSPFSMQSNAEPLMESESQMGYVSLGVLFTKFAEWLRKNHQDNMQYLFLAREGFFLQKVYQKYLDAHNINEKDNSKYFLTSRRAASVATIKSWKDVQEILEQFYRGKLSNLLYARLGFECPDEMLDCEIEMPRDIRSVMNKLLPYQEIILENAERERKAYLKYINSVCDSENQMVIVDVGYAGTIQYYLMKLLDGFEQGYYLCNQCNRKPEKIGGKCDALYFIYTDEEQQCSKIFQCQLFLEAVLKAPYGQMLCFEEKDEKLIPVYKEKDEYTPMVEKVQNGALQFVEKYSMLAGQLDLGGEIDKNLAEDVLFYASKGEWMSEDMEAILAVEDDYCSNGALKFNKKEKLWKVMNDTNFFE